MFRQLSQRALPFLIDVLQPEKQVLPQYTRQIPKTRAMLFNFIGLCIVIAAGAMYGRYFARMPPDKLLVILAPLPLMALLVIWVLPDRATAPTRAMTKLLLAFLAVSVAWPDYLALQLPGLPWISFRRLFLAPTCSLLLVGISTHAGFRKELRDVLNSEPIIGKLFAGFVFFQAISIAGSDAPAVSVRNFINYQLAWTSVFFAALYAFRSMDVTLRFMKMFLIATVAIGIIAILESINHGVLWRGHVPSFLQVDLENMAGTMEAARRNGVYRAKSVFGQPLPFAEIMALSTPLILYFLFTAKVMWKKVALVIIDLVLLYVLTLPQSRLGMIGFLISHALFIGVWSGRIWLRNKFSLIAPMITLAYPVMLIAVAGAVMSVGSLRSQIMGGGDTKYSDQTRKIQRLTARHAILRNPVIGHGPRRAASTLGLMAFSRLSLDNYYLWIALDYGLIGFGIYYAMFLFLIHRMFMISIRDVDRNNNLALYALTTLTVFVIIKAVLSEEDNHSIVFAIMGLAMTIIWRDKEKRAAEAEAEASSNALHNPRVFSGHRPYAPAT